MPTAEKGALGRFFARAPVRLSLIAAMAWLGVETMARGEFSQKATMPEVPAIITVECWYGSLPSYGFVPLEVTIENQSERTHTWSFETISLHNMYVGGSRVTSTTSMSVGGKSTRTFRVL